MAKKSKCRVQMKKKKKASEREYRQIGMRARRLLPPLLNKPISRLRVPKYRHQ